MIINDLRVFKISLHFMLNATDLNIISYKPIIYILYMAYYGIQLGVK